MAFIQSLEPRRLLAAGDLDATFGAAGQVIPSLTVSHDQPFGAAVQTDGKIVQAITNQVTHQIGVRRLNADGSLDKSFGSGGTALFAPAGVPYAALNAVLVQADGKIVAVGTENTTTGGGNFLVARLTSSGTLDTTFSADGLATATFYNGAQANAVDVLQQPDGKIVAAGTSAGHFALARFNTNGTPDTSFDGDGRSSPSLPGAPGAQTLGGIALTSDGEILAVGSIAAGANDTTHDLVLVRYTADGQIDTSFGAASGLTDFHPAGASDTYGADLALQPDGKIVAVGHIADPVGSNRSELLVARFAASGTLDQTFGTNGIAPQPTGRRIQIGDKVAILSDGKILVVGQNLRYITGATDYMALERIGSGGAIDPAFGQAGIASISLSDDGDEPTGLALQPDGKIVLSSVDASAETFDDRQLGGVARLLANGSPDVTFADNGRFGPDLAGVAGDYDAVAIQRDGKIIAVGTTKSLAGGGDDIIVSRYNTDGTPDATFGSAGRTVIDFFGYEDQGDSVALMSDGRIVVSGFARNENVVNVVTVRLKASGALDKAYGIGGKVAEVVRALHLSSFGFEDSIVAVAPDGKVVVAANGAQSEDTVLLRYTAAGVLDTSFASGGVYVFDGISPDVTTINGLRVQPDGKIVIAGNSLQGTLAFKGFFSVVRFDAAGKLDPTFGDGDGIAEYPTGGTFPDVGGLALQSNGDLLVTSSTDLDDTTNIAVRFDASGRPLARYSIVELRDPLVQDDGSFYVTSTLFGAGPFDIGRYLPDGDRDPSFSGASAADAVQGTAIARQADGKIVEVGEVSASLGGGFATQFAVSRFQGDGGNSTPLAAGVLLRGDGTLEVDGTPADDTVLINRFDSKRLRVTRDGVQTRVNRSLVSRILLSGSDGKDALTVTIDLPVIATGGAGNDTITTAGGADALYGDAGNDILIAAAGNDTLYGGSGTDALFGGAGNDHLSGQAGNDYLEGGPGADTVDGGAATDTALTDTLDIITSIENRT